MKEAGIPVWRGARVRNDASAAHQEGQKMRKGRGAFEGNENVGQLIGRGQVKKGIGFIVDKCYDVEIARMDVKIAAMLNRVARGDVQCALIVDKYFGVVLAWCPQSFGEAIYQLTDRSPLVEGNGFRFTRAV